MQDAQIISIILILRPKAVLNHPEYRISATIHTVYGYGLGCISTKKRLIDIARGQRSSCYAEICVPKSNNLYGEAQSLASTGIHLCRHDHYLLCKPYWHSCWPRGARACAQVPKLEKSLSRSTPSQSMKKGQLQISNNPYWDLLLVSSCCFASACSTSHCKLDKATGVL